jgi:hypothetical protein
MPPDSAGQRPTPSTTAPAGSRGTGSRVLLPPRVVAREFARLFREHGVTAHPAEVRRLASRFVAAGHDRLQDVETYVLAYADPTGETAVRKVMRGGPVGS